MQGYDPAGAAGYILAHIDPKPLRSLRGRLKGIIADFIAYDLHFMRLTGVLDENGLRGEGDYDDDEAFEYIYDAWLSDHPDEPDEDMAVAAALNGYMEWQEKYLLSQGLAEL